VSIKKAASRRNDMTEMRTKLSLPVFWRAFS